MKRLFIQACILAVCVAIGSARLEAEVTVKPVSETESEVTFSFKDRGYLSVSVAGSFNSWSATKNPMSLRPDGVWLVTARFPTNSILLWKYVVDGTWVHDPDVETVQLDGFGGKNSLLDIKAAVAAPPRVRQPDAVYPVPRETTRQHRSAVLAYITALSTDTFNGTISGQNCYHGDEITGSSWLNGYDNLITKLHTETGKWVGIAGLDYEYMRIYTARELARANALLIEHAREGGMITICMSPQNPWVNDETDLVRMPGSDTGKGSTRDKTGVTSLDDLINPSMPVHTVWMRKLDRMARALQQLQDAGVVVLWRPMQEMNGDWFWWGMKAHPRDPGPYVRVYRHMHHYFTTVKKLENLIWVYSPSHSGGQGLDSDWNRPVGWAYPGDDVVDIVAGTSYSDTLDILDYEDYLKLGKPMGMAEYSPADSGQARDGSFDNRRYLERIRTDYPRIAYWVSWHHYQGTFWSLITNKNAAELLNHPDIKTREDLPRF